MCDCPHTAAAARLIFQQSRIYAGDGIALSKLTTGRIRSTLNSTSGSDLLKYKLINCLKFESVGDHMRVAYFRMC
jgi:hypothetical protein